MPCFYGKMLIYRQDYYPRDRTRRQFLSSSRYRVTVTAPPLDGRLRDTVARGGDFTYWPGYTASILSSLIDTR